MALIRYGEGQQRSGSMGATVYSHNRYGQYIRARSTPVNPATDRQIAVRVAMSGLAIHWSQTLTQVQRDAWDLYATWPNWTNKLGDAVHLTGLAHYIRSNTPRLLCGLARVDDGPTIPELASPEQLLGCSASQATQQLTLTFDDAHAWCDEDGAAQIVYMGQPQGASIKFFGGPWRRVSCIEGDSIAPPTSPTAALDTPDWPFVEGHRIWVRTRITRADGRLSEYARVNFLAAA